MEKLLNSVPGLIVNELVALGLDVRILDGKRRKKYGNGNKSDS
jgi:hypothetical protein